MIPTEYDEKPDNVKSSLLLQCIGERARKVYDTLNFSTTADSMKLEKTIEQFEAYFNPIKNITFSRFKFFTYRQEIGHIILNSSAINPDYNVDEICRPFPNNQKFQKESPELINKCKFCLFLHMGGSCTTYGKLRNNCKRKNYFAKYCNVK